MAAYDMGMKSSDPFERMRFYSKGSPSYSFKLKREQVCFLMLCYVTFNHQKYYINFYGLYSHVFMYFFHRYRR